MGLNLDDLSDTLPRPTDGVAEVARAAFPPPTPTATAEVIARPATERPAAPVLATSELFGNAQSVDAVFAAAKKRHGSLVVVNSKGGSGKTSILTLLAEVLSRGSERLVAAFDANTNHGLMAQRFICADPVNAEQLLLAIRPDSGYGLLDELLGLSPYGTRIVASCADLRDRASYELLLGFLRRNSSFLLIDSGNDTHAESTDAALKFADLIVLCCNAKSSESIQICRAMHESMSRNEQTPVVVLTNAPTKRKAQDSLRAQLGNPQLLCGIQHDPEIGRDHGLDISKLNPNTLRQAVNAILTILGQLPKLA